MTAPTPAEPEAAARRMLGHFEPDGSYASYGFFEDAAIVARALLSFSRVERERALEEAAKVAEEYARLHPLFNHGTQPSRVERAVMDAAAQIAAAIRSLSPTDGAPANPPKVRTP